MNYENQRKVAVAVAIISAGLVILQGNPGDFGLPVVAAHWVGLLASMLAVAASFLPNVRAPSKDPNFLVNRIEELSKEDQQKVATTLADHAEQDHLLSQMPGWLRQVEGQR